jgi:hypothetical protein
MDVKQFESIKAKIEVLKEKKIKAETNIEGIVTNWEKQYGIKTVEEAQALLDDTAEKIKDNEKEIDELFRELDGVTEWALV